MLPLCSCRNYLSPMWMILSPATLGGPQRLDPLLVHALPLLFMKVWIKNMKKITWKNNVLYNLWQEVGFNLLWFEHDKSSLIFQISITILGNLPKFAGKFTWWRLTHKASDEAALGWVLPSLSLLQATMRWAVVPHYSRSTTTLSHTTGSETVLLIITMSWGWALPSSSCVCQASVIAVKNLRRPEARRENHVLEVISRGRVQEHWDNDITFCLKLGVVYYPKHMMSVHEIIKHSFTLHST